MLWQCVYFSFCRKWYINTVFNARLQFKETDNWQMTVQLDKTTPNIYKGFPSK